MYMYIIMELFSAWLWCELTKNELVSIHFQSA